MERNSTAVLAVIFALVIGAIGGYYVGVQQASGRGMAIYQQGTPQTTTGAETQNNPTVMVPPAGSASPIAMGSTEQTISLLGQNNSGQSGTATISEENGKVKVVLQLKGGTFAEPQPAHIHMGMCPTPGDIVYPLTNVVNGTSETFLATTMEALKAKEPLAINVHKSANEANVYTACGDLK